MADLQSKKISELNTHDMSTDSGYDSLVGLTEVEVDGEKQLETVRVPMSEIIHRKGEDYVPGTTEFETVKVREALELGNSVASHSIYVYDNGNLQININGYTGADGQVLMKGVGGGVCWGTPSVEGLASESYVDDKVAGIVNSAPAALDTLNELSKALGNDANFSATVATQIGNKVDKANGKGLSTNDYTTAEKNKLAGIAEGANNYSHPETHPASMITGLSKVATSGSYNDLADKPTIPSIVGLATEKYVDEKISSLPSGGGSGGGASIIYATEKPSTPQQAIYVITEDEVVKVELYQSQILPSEMAYCEIVDALPEIGNPAMDLTAQALYTYYLTTDGELYGYVDAALEAAGGVPVGWYPVAPLFGSVGTTYGGKITSTDQATDASTMYALLTKAPKTRVYVPLQDGAFLELTSGIRTRFDEYNGNVSITEV